MPAVATRNLYSGVPGTWLFENRFFQLTDQDDNEGKTFLLQYLANTPKGYRKNIQYHTTVLQGKAREKWEISLLNFERFCRLCNNCAY
jgi:hypothetical protein